VYPGQRRDHTARRNGSSKCPSDARELRLYAILTPVPDIDIVDSTWICATPTVVAAAVSEAANWRRWWPDLELTVDEWRGVKGMRWLVRAPSDSAAGSMEVWLEPDHDGVVAHYFLRLDALDGRPMSPRARDRITDRRRRHVKQVLWALADQLDPGRTARVAGPRVG
jgi:hypothetical protein